MKNNLTIKQNQKIIQAKTRDLMSITNKILSQKNQLTAQDDSWMQRLWDCEDEHNILHKDLPRNRNKLLKKHHLKLILVYFGLNKPSTDNEEKVSLSIKIGEFPKELGKLIQLEKLCINYNFIERLPDSIINLKNIKKLCLCHNKDLVLTLNQQLWKLQLENSGAIIEYDEDLMHRAFEEIEKI